MDILDHFLKLSVGFIWSNDHVKAKLFKSVGLFSEEEKKKGGFLNFSILKLWNNWIDVAFLWSQL